MKFNDLNNLQGMCTFGCNVFSSCLILSHKLLQIMKPIFFHIDLICVLKYFHPY